MEVIKLLLTDEDLNNITGGMTIEKRIKNNYEDIIMTVSYTGEKTDIAYTGGKDDPGGNDIIFGKGQ
ncbi:MAG: hypothetical protein IKE28_09650 [Solobacterium sp.]|nr:hypothetical protein [Solobacterium sp.]